MTFTQSRIPDVIVIEPKIFRDERGFFFEEYNREIFFKNGIRVNFVQDNHSLSAKGTVRGLHYQIPPKAQDKLVYVVRGKIFDVAVDLRKKSKTFGQYVSHVLSAENKKMLFIPAGFAHGFFVLEKDSEVIYKVSQGYSREHERGLLWNDPKLGIDWPKLKASHVLSSKDQKHPLLKKAEIFN